LCRFLLQLSITPLRGNIRGEWVEHGENTGRVILYFHGGAYIAGSPRTHRPLTAALARDAGARVLALDYRQAPEYGIPRHGWRMRLRLTATFCLPDERPHQIVLAGDSAGGNLVLVTLLRLRELGLPMPAGAICLSPWADLACKSRSFSQNRASEVMLNADAIAALGRHHIGTNNPRDPLTVARPCRFHRPATTHDSCRHRRNPAGRCPCREKGSPESRPFRYVSRMERNATCVPPLSSCLARGATSIKRDGHICGTGDERALVAHDCHFLLHSPEGALRTTHGALLPYGNFFNSIKALSYVTLA
jgi:acetyl esterase/lipase